jgi:hypothetical protein
MKGYFMTTKNFSQASLKIAKIAVGSAVLLGLGATTMAYAQKESLPTVEKVELDRYLGTWYEVARKPLYFQNKCDRDVTATYTLNENGNIVKSLPENTVFVFGSNMAGLHAGGAARTALEHFGAVEGVGRGWSGQSYAIPTMNEHLQQMPLSQIQHYIDDFKIYTKNHPKNKYFLTSVGCGIAGYKVEEIAPMFKGISHNVIFPQSFRPFVEKPLPKLNEKFLKT